MKARIIVVLIMTVALAGCAGGKKKDLSESAASPPFSDEAYESDNGRKDDSGSHKSGSLWQQERGSLFTANKATAAGDIVTVAIYEQASAEKEAETATDRSSNASLGISKLFGLEKSLVDKNPNLDPTSLLSSSSENNFQGSGSTSREESLSATLTTRVVKVMQNGNLGIEGSKTVTVNNEDQVIRLSGVVRQSDIMANNVVDSKYILDAKIEYSGKGVISEKQRPGWLARLIDIAWPL
ncbi:MAG: flagellar basal body L-ring protein FlgH [Thermodesulfobacteriota bacterium]